MAERRMFAKAIVTSDAFLDMSLSARCLYFTLGMFADDDGFVNNPKSIMRQVGASIDDLNLLLMKKFILAFESGIIVIKHWRIHNYIQKDRYKETKYIEEKSLLMLDEKCAYTFGGGTSLCEEKTRKPLTEAQQKRLDAKNESSLPYSFEYKIRQAFNGERCPICNCTMDGSNNLIKPTIQHNIPISLGGKHEIDNISVICSSCNCSIQNRQETPPYNTERVKEIWQSIGNGVGMDTQVSIGKDRIGKDRIVEDNTTTTTNNHSFIQSEEFALFTKVAKVFGACKAKSNPEDFIAYNEARGWLGIGGESVLDNLERYVCRWESYEIAKRGNKECELGW